VVRLDGVDHVADSPYLRAASRPTLACDPSTSWVSAFPMSCRKAQRRRARVEAELAGHQPGEVRRLDQVLEDVLPVRRAVPQPAEQRDELGCRSVITDVRPSRPRLPAGTGLDLALGLLVSVLDALRVDAPVQHQSLQRDPGDLTAYRVEAGQQHRLRAVVDDALTPVTDSKARMLRPSRPMMRPFMSSLGRCRT
jgi:hypothetical protein